MIAFLVDQNFNEHIVDGMTRRDVLLEFTHVRDVGLAEAPILWCWNGRRGEAWFCLLMTERPFPLSPMPESPLARRCQAFFS